MVRLNFTESNLLITDTRNGGLVVSVGVTAQPPRPATYTTIKHRGKPVERVLKQPAFMKAAVHEPKPVELLGAAHGSTVEVVYAGTAWAADLQYRHDGYHPLQQQWVPQEG